MSDDEACDACVEQEEADEEDLPAVEMDVCSAPTIEAVAHDEQVVVVEPLEAGEGLGGDASCGGSDSVLQQLQRLDEDGSGKVGRDELQALLLSINHGSYSEEQVKQLLDASGVADGQVDYQAFVSSLFKPEAQAEADEAERASRPEAIRQALQVLMMAPEEDVKWVLSELQEARPEVFQQDDAADDDLEEEPASEPEEEDPAAEEVERPAAKSKRLRFDTFETLLVDMAKEGRRLGVAIGPKLQIKKVEDGLISAHNSAHSDRRVLVGDHFYEVNGVHVETSHQLVQAFGKEAVVKATLVRRVPGLRVLDMTIHKGEQRLGVHIGTSLEIAQIDDGAVKAHNAAHPAEQVLVGDRFVMANGVVVCTKDEFVQAVGKGPLLRVKLQRKQRA